jgi:hypothetical protein
MSLPISETVEKLKTRIEDLESSIEINRKVIHDLIYLRLGDISTETSDTTSNFSPKALELMISENLKLNSEFKSSIKERNTAQSKALISQQIAIELELKILETKEEYEQKIHDYNYQIQTKNRLIEDLTRYYQRISDKLENSVYSTNVEPVNPSNDIIKLHANIERLQQITRVAARKCYIANSYRDSLFDLSKSIYNNCRKVQALLKNPINKKSSYADLEISTPRELSFESESSSESSYIDISERNSSTIGNKRNVVPSMDFSKIINKRNSNGLNKHFNTESETNIEKKAFKLLYTKLYDKMNKNSRSLHKICSKNDKLMEENTKLVAELYKNQNSKLSTDKKEEL